MVSVPVGVTVRLVCVECLRSAMVACGPGIRGIMKGSEMKTQNMRDLIAKVELAELTGQFDGLNATDVPGFDHAFEACDRAGIPLTADGLRSLVRRVATAAGESINCVMGHSPEWVATNAKNYRLRRDGSYTPQPVAV